MRSLVKSTKGFPGVGCKFENTDFDDVTHLQARHFVLRDFWRLEDHIKDGSDEKYFDSEITSISDQHDELIDYHVMETFPASLIKIFNDKVVLLKYAHSCASVTQDNYEEKFLSLIEHKWSTCV